MAKTDEKEALSLINRYYNEISLRNGILAIFMGNLGPLALDEKRLQKARLSQDELDSEVVCALLETFKEVHETSVDGYKKIFLTKLRAGLRTFSTKKNFVNIEDVSIQDENPNPEEAYAMKEQIEFIKRYLKEHYDPETVDWFMRRYANGDKVMEIANDYHVTRQTVEKRIVPVLERVRKYMEKINGDA